MDGWMDVISTSQDLFKGSFDSISKPAHLMACIDKFLSRYAVPLCRPHSTIRRVMHLQQPLNQSLLLITSQHEQHTQQKVSRRQAHSEELQ